MRTWIRFSLVIASLWLFPLFAQNPGWTDAQRIGRDRENWEAWKAAQRAAIDQAEDTGRYYPKGRPASWWLVGAGAAAGMCAFLVWRRWQP